MNELTYEPPGSKRAVQTPSWVRRIVLQQR